MSSLDDLIRFDIPTDWELAINQTRTAQILGQNSHVPIPPFDLGVNLTSPYVLIVVQTTQAQTTWRWGGEVRQTWDFPSGGAIGGQTGVAQSEPTQLFLNKVQLVELNPAALSPYRLRYQAPHWFRDVIVYGWKYNGVVENFVKDTLFDIGNKVGIGTIDPPDSLTNLIFAINEKLIDLEALINNLSSQGGLSPSPSNPIPDSQVNNSNLMDEFL